MMKNRFVRILLRSLLFAFVLLNILAYNHSYNSVHFSTDPTTKNPNLKDAGLFEKVKVGLLGFKILRPADTLKAGNLVGRVIDTVYFKSDKKLEGWYIQTLVKKDATIKTVNAANKPRGTVIIFPGYRRDKGSMADRGDVFLNLGYDCLLVDFRGVGGSEGNDCTVGLEESKDVKAAYDFIKSKGNGDIILFGTSMGAASILRSMEDFKDSLEPQAIVLECPFASMRDATKGTMRLAKLPTTLLPDLMMFWGSYHTGHWSYNLKPAESAKYIKCPTLLVWGEKDIRVLQHETNEIYQNLKGTKKLLVFSNCGHENYLYKYNSEYKKELKEFVDTKIHDAKLDEKKRY
jgi:uncharacterized protein